MNAVNFFLSLNLSVSLCSAVVKPFSLCVSPKLIVINYIPSRREGGVRVGSFRRRRFHGRPAEMEQAM